MDFSIVWAESAITDLEQIVRYIAQDDPSAAQRLGEGVIGSVDQIGRFSNRGRVVPEEGDDNLREILYSPYRIVEAMGNSYPLLDMTVYERQEWWEDSPTGCPQPWKDDEIEPLSHRKVSHRPVASGEGGALGRSGNRPALIEHRGIQQIASQRSPRSLTHWPALRRRCPF